MCRRGLLCSVQSGVRRRADRPTLRLAMAAAAALPSPASFCCICRDDKHCGGLLCSEGHLTCRDCTPRYCVAFAAERSKLLQNQDMVPCPFREDKYAPCN